MKEYRRVIPDLDSDCAASIRFNQWYKDLAVLLDDPDATLEQKRELFEHWGDNAGEPEDVDYLDVIVGGVKCLAAIPHGCNEERVLICVHGGGYIHGNRFTHRKGYTHLAKQIGCKALLVDYGRLPDYPWPAPQEDVMKVYQSLLAEGITADHIAFTGDSAGGAICLAMPLLCKDRGIPMPAALMPVSPWADCMASTSLYETNDKDVVNSREGIAVQGRYLQEIGVDIYNPRVASRYLTEEQMKGYPPIYITVGGYESMLEEAEIVAATANRAGVDVRLDIVEHMQHSLTQIGGRCKNADNQIQRFSEWARRILKL